MLRGPALTALRGDWRVGQLATQIVLDDWRGGIDERLGMSAPSRCAARSCESAVRIMASAWARNGGSCSHISMIADATARPGWVVPATIHFDGGGQSPGPQRVPAPSS